VHGQQEEPMYLFRALTFVSAKSAPVRLLFTHIKNQFVKTGKVEVQALR
jgi:hypothetical protein